MKTSFYVALVSKNWIQFNALLKCALKVKLRVFTYRLIDKFASSKHLKRFLVSYRTKPYNPLQLLQATWNCNAIRYRGNATGYCWQQKKYFYIAVCSW